MASSSSVKKRNYLKLEKKVEVIKAMERDRTLNHRTLASMFNCGRTQIAQILKNKDSVMSLYQSNQSKN